MTGEEAIKKLKEQQNEFNEHYIDYAGINEAYKMAIEALEQHCEDNKAKNDNEIIHCKDCKYRDYWGDCTKWSKELDAHKSYILDENMFCGFAEIKDGE